MSLSSHNSILHTLISLCFINYVLWKETSANFVNDDITLSDTPVIFYYVRHGIYIVIVFLYFMYPYIWCRHYSSVRTRDCSRYCSPYKDSSQLYLLPASPPSPLPWELLHGSWYMHYAVIGLRTANLIVKDDRIVLASMYVVTNHVATWLSSLFVLSGEEIRLCS